MNEFKAREQIVRVGQSLFQRGLSFGASGNISVKTDSGWLMTPTGVSMAELEPDLLSLLDESGRHLSGPKPTKESFLHLAMYEQRPAAGAVVHLHSSHSAAVSCLHHENHDNVLPPLTAYYVMKIGILPLVPYFAPGDMDLAKAVAEKASRSHALLLANHGPVVAGKNLLDALYATEELEETAKLYLLLQNMRENPLSVQAVADLNRRFPKEI